MSARSSHRGRLLLAATLAAVAVAATAIAATALAGQPARPGFPALHPAAAPASWPRATLLGGAAVLAFPPSLRRVISDADAVSAAQLGPGGGYQLYLNATPRQGAENLATGPRSGCGCCGLMTPPRPACSPPPAGSSSAAAPARASSTPTSPGSVATISPRSPA